MDHWSENLQVLVFLGDVLFLEVSFRMECDLVPEEASTRRHVLKYHSMRCKMFPKDETWDFLKVGVSNLNTFSLSLQLGDVHFVHWKIVGCQVAGAAALLFSWLRSATNTVKSVEDAIDVSLQRLGWKVEFLNQSCLGLLLWEIMGCGQEVGRRGRNKFTQAAWTMNIGVTDVFSKIVNGNMLFIIPVANAGCFAVESHGFLQVPDDLIAIRTFVGCFWRQLKNCALVKIVLGTWNFQKKQFHIGPMECEILQIDPCVHCESL